MAMRQREDLVFPNAAAIDVGGSSRCAAPPHSTDAPVHEVGEMTDELSGLVDWLLVCGVDVVALESTGMYWILVHVVLEQRGLNVWLVDAQQVKFGPGRKGDVQDCQWLQKLVSDALLRPTFQPNADVCVIRAVARQCEVLLTQQASWGQRMQRAPLLMNIQLTETISEVMAQPGQAGNRDIVAGQREPKVLANHRHRIKASEQDIVRALTGNRREEHLLVLRQALATYDDIAKHLAQCDAKLQSLLAKRSAASVDLGRAPKAGGKARAEFDVRQQLANWAGADLTRMNGHGLDSVMKILGELGPDHSRFANVKHFCSWLGLSPATKISGGKVLSTRTKSSANRIRQALKMAATRLSQSDSALGAFYRLLCARLNMTCADTAAHKLAWMVYFMLTRGGALVNEGQQHYEEQPRERSIVALKHRAAALGCQINPVGLPSDNGCPQFLFL